MTRGTIGLTMIQMRPVGALNALMQQLQVNQCGNAQSTRVTHVTEDSAG